MAPPSFYYENVIPDDICDLTEEEMEAFFNDTTTQSRTHDAPRAEQNPRPATEKAPEVRPAETEAASIPSKSSRHVRVESPSPSKDTQRPPVTPVKPPANNGTTSRSYGTPKAPMAQPSPSKKIQYVPTQTQDASFEGGPQPTPSQYKGEEGVHGVRRMTIRQLQNAKKDFSASHKDVFKTEDDYSYITAVIVATVRTIANGKDGNERVRAYTLFDCTGEIRASMFPKHPLYYELPKELKNPAYPKNNRLRYVRVVVKMGEPYHGRNSLIILDLRPISHPFEPYAHQYGCMYDTMRYWKIKGIRPEGITEPEPVVNASKTSETPRKAIEPQPTTTHQLPTTPKPATTSKPTKTPVPVETPSRSSSGFSSYVSVNEELAASDSAESFDMVAEPVESPTKPEGSRDVTSANTRNTNSAGPHPDSFVESSATSGMSSAYTASAAHPSASAANPSSSSAANDIATSANDLTSVVSRLSLADEPYPDPDYSISGHLAANKVVGAVGRAQHSPPQGQRSPPHAQWSPPHAQRSPPHAQRSSPRKSDPTTPQHMDPPTPQRAADATPHSPLTPQATTPDKSNRRKSKDYRRSSHAHSSPRTPELDTSPRSPDTSRRSNDRNTYDANGTPRSPQPLPSPRSPQPLADLTTDQRNIILCIQKAYHKVGPHEQWIGVYHGDIAKYVVSKSIAGERSILSHNKDDVVAQAASISNDIETLVDKGYLTTTVDEDHFDCRDHSHGRYRRYTEILADLSLYDD